MPTFDEWSELTDGYDIPVIAALCKMHRTTVKRWRDRAVPYVVERFLRVELHGELPARDGWRGWRIGSDGLLYPPDMRRGFSPGDVRSIHWWQQVKAWREALRKTGHANAPGAPIARSLVRSDKPFLPVRD